MAAAVTMAALTGLPVLPLPFSVHSFYILDMKRLNLTEAVKVKISSLDRGDDWLVMQKSFPWSSTLVMVFDPPHHNTLVLCA